MLEHAGNIPGPQSHTFKRKNVRCNTSVMCLVDCHTQKSVKTYAETRPRRAWFTVTRRRALERTLENLRDVPYPLSHT